MLEGLSDSCHYGTVTVADSGQTRDLSAIAFEAYGLRVAVEASEDVLELLRRVVPPDSKPCDPDAVQTRFSVTRSPVGTYAVNKDGQQLIGRLDLDMALEMRDSKLRIYLGRKSHESIFIHAGVVAHRGMGIAIPGRSFSGKTSLVAALVRAGAVYYSDEFAVIDRDGLVRPYAKDLSVRDNGWAQTHRAVETFGGVAGREPVPLRMIVITTYRPDAEWRPETRSAGSGAMALLGNAVPARERSREVLEAVRRAADGAVVLEGDRGDAEALAPLLLKELERQAA
jgi:hypothetical protein